MFPKVHLVTKRGSVLSLDASVTQQRLEHDLNVKAQNTFIQSYYKLSTLLIVILVFEM